MRINPAHACILMAVIMVAFAPASTGASAAGQDDRAPRTYGPIDTPGKNSGEPDTASVTPAAIPAGLASAVDQSLDQNPSVLARLAEVAALQSDLSAAKWQRFPNLTAEILATTGGSSIADTDGLAVNLALEQPIWAGGAIASQIDAARFNRDVGLGTLREARFNILLAIAQSWYDALRAFERARTLEEGLAQHRELVARIERRVAQEVSPRADLILARSRVTQLEVELATAQEQGENAMLQLTEFVGAPVAEPAFSKPAVVDEVPPEPIALQDMTACSPSLDRLQSQINVAEAQVRGARASLLPQVLLQLSQNEITGARAAIVLRAQTGNGLSRLSAVDSAKSRVDQARADLGQADRQVRTRLRSEYVVLNASAQREEAARLAAEAASALLASYERQFVAGRRSWLDVLNAAREKTNAQVSQSDAWVGMIASATRILALSCRWRPAGL